MNAHSVPYDSPVYWDERFRREGNFEWLVSFETLAPLLFGSSVASRQDAALVTASDCILHIGCGSSRLGVQLARAGCARVINADISSVAVEMGRQRMLDTEADAALASRLDWLQLDAMDMRDQIGDASIDVILDKSTMDAITCGDSTDTVIVCDGIGTSHLVEGACCARLAQEAGRVLRMNGRWVVVSYSDSRLQFDSASFNSTNEQQRSIPTIADLHSPADSTRMWRWHSDPIRRIERSSETPPAGAPSDETSVVHRPPTYYYVYVHRKVPIE